jgi:hypothetical protein
MATFDDIASLKEQLEKKTAAISKEIFGADTSAWNKLLNESNRKRKREKENVEPSRRSTRNLGIMIDYKEETIMLNNRNTTTKLNENSPDNAEENEKLVLRSLAPAPANSSRSMDARIDYLIEEYLGKEVPIALGGPGNQAKRAVMVEATGKNCVFNRMSGIQQFKNAIFLFVNVEEDENGGYRNCFLNDGRQIYWFAQDRMNEASPLVLQLIHHESGYSFVPGKELDEKIDDSDSKDFLPPAQVCLIMRLPGEPYVFCGRLQYVSHLHEPKPIRFTWNLLDFDKLLSRPQFQQVLRIAQRLGKSK